jgi:ABC-type multidrug transport system ATPase subunit
MKILLQQAGKKYYNQWVFRSLDLRLETGETLAVLGPNGSGKSTLLQVLSGAHLLNEGSITHLLHEKKTDAEDVFRSVSIAAPYLELIEEFTLEESVKLHFSFKQTMQGLPLSEVIRLSGLQDALHKPVKFFSSGMKQRLKLTLACLSDTPLLLLDEPCANLDENGVQWYSTMVREYGKGKTIVVCSNSHAEEFAFCAKKISVTDYKYTPARQKER